MLYFSRPKFILPPTYACFIRWCYFQCLQLNTFFLFTISPSSATCPIRFISNTFSQQEVINP